MRKKLIGVVGPTASGKTALAGRLASVFGSEIVNADSRQLYKGMDIGTAKELPKRTIHLIDIIEPNQVFSVAQYKALAIQTIEGIIKRGAIPFLVGGTGLYIKAVIENLEIPEVTPQGVMRAKLERMSEGELYAMVKRVDPLSAGKIDIYNKRRLIRALEVALVTGESFWGQIQKGPPLYDVLLIGIDISREKLFHNIEERVARMIERGLEKEVRRLVKRYGWTPVLTTTIGYKEWKDYFEGEKTREEVASDIVKHTKQLVKKQRTWFNKQEGIHWVKNEKEAFDLACDVKVFYDRNV